MGGSIMGNAGRVLMIPKGEYNSATTYEMLDFVYYQGRSYVCKQTSTGNVPTNTTYWQALTGDASAEIQALTNYVADNGVKNEFDFTKYDVYNGTVTVNGNALHITATNKVNANAYYTINNLKKNTDYVIALNIDYTSGVSGVYVGGSTTTSNFTSLIDQNYTADTAVALSFNTGNYEYFRISLFATHGSTAMDGDTTFSEIMITPKAVYDADPTYQPYAKTNVELTQESASADYTDQSLFTNIDDTAIARPNLRVYKRGSAIYGIFTFDIIRTVTNGEVLFKAPIAPKVDTNFVGTGVGTSDLAQGFVWKSNGNVCSYGSNTAADYIASSVSTIIS